MIGRVVSRPKRPFKLLEYLFGPGRKNEHVRPHLVAAWAGCPERLEPPGEGTQGRWTWRLAQTLLAPTELAHGVVPWRWVRQPHSRVLPLCACRRPPIAAT